MLNNFIFYRDLKHHRKLGWQKTDKMEWKNRKTQRKRQWTLIETGERGEISLQWHSNLIRGSPTAMAYGQYIKNQRFPLLFL
jgi:hypothetical protein